MPTSQKRDAQIAPLQNALGYVFRDMSLLDHALTHVSALATANGTDPQKRKDSYQRLEFLGDRVLGLCVAAMLYEAFPNAPEGELSIRLANLVRRETCAQVAEFFNLGAYLRLGPGEMQTGGRRKQPILADCCESVIGALFVDGGFAVADQFIRKHWHALMMDAQDHVARDAKTRLQEFVQAHGLPAPLYEEAARSGPQHAPSFMMKVLVQDGAGAHHSALGEASSKRAAEQAAAQNFLDTQAQKLLPDNVKALDIS